MAWGCPYLLLLEATPGSDSSPGLSHGAELHFPGEGAKVTTCLFQKRQCGRGDGQKGKKGQSPICPVFSFLGT